MGKVVSSLINSIQINIILKYLNLSKYINVFHEITVIMVRPRKRTFPVNAVRLRTRGNLSCKMLRGEMREPPSITAIKKLKIFLNKCGEIYAKPPERYKKI